MAYLYSVGITVLGFTAYCLSACTDGGSRFKSLQSSLFSPGGDNRAYQLHGVGDRGGVWPTMWTLETWDFQFCACYAFPNQMARSFLSIMQLLQLMSAFNDTRSYWDRVLPIFGSLISPLSSGPKPRTKKVSSAVCYNGRYFFFNGVNWDNKLWPERI